MNGCGCVVLRIPSVRRPPTEAATTEAVWKGMYRGYSAVVLKGGVGCGGEDL